MKHLRIFQILEGSTNQAVPDNRTWLRNLYEPLIEMGHDVILFPASQGRQAMIQKNSQLKAEFSQRLLDAFQQEHHRKPFDLVFAYLMDGMIDPGVLLEISKSDVPLCNFSCNNAHQFYLVGEISPYFDFNLHAEKDVQEKFLKIGANPLWWPMASNPKYFHPIDTSKTIDVSFVGANYGVRARYIAHLLRNSVPVHVYGPRWQLEGSHRWKDFARRVKLLAQATFIQTHHQKAYHSAKLAEFDFHRKLFSRYPTQFHSPVTDAELINLYSQSKISLGFLEVYKQHDPSEEITQHLHLREFEAPMCGAFYITGYSEELAEFFEPGKEIVVYRNIYELLDKVRFYLAHPDKAEEIRKAGYQRAIKEHTYHHRFNSLFQQIGLNA